MKRSNAPIFLLSSGLLAFGLTLNGGRAAAQAGETKYVPITSHIYEVAPIETTIERIKGLHLPPGFQVAKFAEIQNPRMMAVAPDGTVYVSSRDLGVVRMLKDTNGDGVADVQKTVAERPKLHGIAIYNGKMYLETVKEVFIADMKPDGTLGELKQIISDLPDNGQHQNRTLTVGPDNKLYMSVGSTTNVAIESDRESATILRANLDGSDRKIFASGLRNTIGYGWHPTTKRFWGWDQGIDFLGDEEQAEEFNELLEGKKYGWPFVYEKGRPHPHVKPPAPLGLTNEDWAKQSQNPTLLYTAHSAGMQMIFYTGAMFPAEYQNDAFIALRGSWNRNPPSGYEIVRIRFDKNGAATKIEPFVSSFLVKGGSKSGDGKDAHFGRLAGVAVAKDGALLFSDDTNGVIYRVSYNQGAKPLPAIMSREDVSITLPETATAKSRLTVASGAFKDGGAIPDPYSSYYQGVSPSLSWKNAPKETKSFVVMVEDPDAMVKPVTHWICANLPPTVTELSENQPKTDTLPEGAIQGGNNTGAIGYFGPHPPAADKPHHYHFQVFALDTMLTLPVGFNRQALLDAMKNHVLAKGETIGLYQRRPDVRDLP